MTLNDLQHFSYLIQGYLPSDQDHKAADNDIIYYGFLAVDGKWYITEEDVSVGGDDDVRAVRYIKGASGYSTFWSNRETLDYELLDEAFK